MSFQHTSTLPYQTPPTPPHPTCTPKDPILTWLIRYIPLPWEEATGFTIQVPRSRRCVSQKSRYSVGKMKLVGMKSKSFTPNCRCMRLMFMYSRSLRVSSDDLKKGGWRCECGCVVRLVTA